MILPYPNCCSQSQGPVAQAVGRAWPLGGFRADPWSVSRWREESALAMSAVWWANIPTDISQHISPHQKSISILSNSLSISRLWKQEPQRNVNHYVGSCAQRTCCVCGWICVHVHHADRIWEVFLWNLNNLSCFIILCKSMEYSVHTLQWIKPQSTSKEDSQELNMNTMECIISYYWILLNCYYCWSVINPTISHLKAFASASPQAFREKIRKAHPDAGGTAKEFKEAEDFDVIWRDGIRWDMEYEVAVYDRICFF